MDQCPLDYHPHIRDRDQMPPSPEGLGQAGCRDKKYAQPTDTHLLGFHLKIKAGKNNQTGNTVAGIPSASQSSCALLWGNLVSAK